MIEDWKQRAAAVSMLRRYGAWTVSKELRLPIQCVKKIAREERTSIYKRGRGRRISAELREQVLAGIRAGSRVVDLKREFHVSGAYVVALRQRMGDAADHRKPSFRKRQLSAEEYELFVADICAGMAQRKLAKKWRMNVRRIRSFIAEVGRKEAFRETAIA
jgi:hypothetical protein